MTAGNNFSLKKPSETKKSWNFHWWNNSTQKFKDVTILNLCCSKEYDYSESAPSDEDVLCQCLVSDWDSFVCFCWISFLFFVFSTFFCSVDATYCRYFPSQRLSSKKTCDFLGNHPIYLLFSANLKFIKIISSPREDMRQCQPLLKCYGVFCF